MRTARHTAKVAASEAIRKTLLWEYDQLLLLLPCAARGLVESSAPVEDPPP